MSQPVAEDAPHVAIDYNYQYHNTTGAPIGLDLTFTVQAGSPYRIDSIEDIRRFIDGTFSDTTIEIDHMEQTTHEVKYTPTLGVCWLRLHVVDPAGLHPAVFHGLSIPGPAFQEWKAANPGQVVDAVGAGALPNQVPAEPELEPEPEPAPAPEPNQDPMPATVLSTVSAGDDGKVIEAEPVVKMMPMDVTTLAKEGALVGPLLHAVGVYVKCSTTCPNPVTIQSISMMAYRKDHSVIVERHQPVSSEIARSEILSTSADCAYVMVVAWVKPVSVVSDPSLASLEPHGMSIPGPAFVPSATTVIAA